MAVVGEPDQAATALPPQDWFTAVMQTPQILKRMAFRKRTLQEELQEASSSAECCVHQRSAAAGCSSPLDSSCPPPAHPCRRNLQALLRGSMRKAFGGFDLLMLGLGITIASGFAQLTGYAAQQYAGCVQRAAPSASSLLCCLE